MMRTFFSGLLAFAVLISISSAQSSLSVSGTITDARSNPIHAATVALLNTNRATITDEKGVFTFKNISSGKYTVQVSAVGYATASKVVTFSPATASQLQFTLEDADISLGTVVVTAQKKKNNYNRFPSVSVHFLLNKCRNTGFGMQKILQPSFQIFIHPTLAMKEM
ncbi:MAG: carboxypeptidase-like regulatory domain-containing protein [Agriterribacter sp.]